MSLSIKTDLGAPANVNLQKVSGKIESSISRLATGNAIAKPSDNVASMATGTALSSQVAVMSSARQNVSIGKAMSAVTNGGLQNIQELLKHMLSLSTQANNPSLNLQTLSYLDADFQASIEQINNIATQTNFNGVDLLNGALYNPSSLDTKNSELNSVAASSVLSFSNSTATTFAATDTLVIGGVTFTFRADAASMTSSPLDVDLTDATPAGQVNAIMSAINKTLASIDPTKVAQKNALSSFNFVADTTNKLITITAKNGGAAANTIAVSTAATGAGKAASQVTLNGGDIIDLTKTFDTGTKGVNGDLYSGSLSSTGTAYNGSDTTVARGTVADTILKPLTTNAAATTGVNASGISNNAAFTGTIGGMSAKFTQQGYADMSMTVGNYTYIANSVNTSPTADTIVRFSSIEAGGGYFDLQFSNAGGSAAVTNQSDADKFATRVNSALEGISFYQKRTVSSYTGAGSVYPAGSTNNSIGNLAGSSFTLVDNSFQDSKIEKVVVSSPTSGGSNGYITFTINGEEYNSGFDGTGANSNLGTTLTTGSYGFVNAKDSTKMLVFKYNSSTALDISTAVNAQGVENALNNAFGLNNGSTAVSFQTGATPDDKIVMQVESATPSSLFRDNTNTYKALSITTQANAADAFDIIKSAANKVTSIIASVGAVESRLNYAGDYLDTSIQNQDAARGLFLDTDVATESGNFARLQVQLQSSIAMLVQANEIPQALLELIR
jgi:flagellin